MFNILRKKGWEINPSKIQGPRQNVKFLGINWDKGHGIVMPKAKQKILEFTTPKSKKEAPKFIGLFGYWGAHIPHLGQILQLLYRVTRKKYNFQWGEKQNKAFEEAKLAIQTALHLWLMREGSIKFQVQWIILLQIGASGRNKMEKDCL